MTDLEKFIELYKSVGIELKAELHWNDKEREQGIQRLLLSQDNSDKFGGYNGFESDIDFDKDGKFIKQDFYE